MGVAIEIRLISDGKLLRSFVAPANLTHRLEFQPHEWVNLDDGDRLVGIDVKPTILDEKGGVR